MNRSRISWEIILIGALMVLLGLYLLRPDSTETLTPAGDSGLPEDVPTEGYATQMDQVFPALALARISAEVTFGNIRVFAHEHGDVRLGVTLPEGISEEDFRRHFVLTVNKSAETLEIRLVANATDQEGMPGWLVRLFSPSKRGFTPTVWMGVPAGALTYHLRSTAGNIVVSKVGGDLVVATSAGNITLDEVFGNIDAETRAGNVRATTIDGNASLRTRAGNVVVSESSGNLTIRTSAGNIEYEGSSVGNSLDAETRIGNITVSIPAQSNVELNLSGSSLVIDPDFEVFGEREERFVRGRFGMGGGLLKADTRIGSIRIKSIEP
jgi:hypothetical protein